MKRPFIILTFILLTFSFHCLNLHAFESKETVQTEILFLCLKEGNASGILNLFTDPILAQKKALFENNRSYSNFLKNTYEGSSLFISKIERLSDAKSIVDVEIHFLQGGPPLKT
ncbi:hypothetical protein KA005_44565, partial [bacterium]|nr:hypothetical protein [bacterium]